MKKVLTSVFCFVAGLSLLAATGCTGSTPGLGVAGTVGYRAVCATDTECSMAPAMNSDINIDGVTNPVGVSPCRIGQYFNVPATDGWVGMYVSPDGVGDGQSPARPIAPQNIVETEKLYVSLLPGVYDDIGAVIAKASQSIRIVSPCAHDHTIVIPAGGIEIGQGKEAVFRGVSFDLTGSMGVLIESDARAWINESVFRGEALDSFGVRAEAAELVWLSHVKFEGLDIAGLVQARSTKLESVWFSGQRQGSLVVCGDANFERAQGAAQSLVGLAGDGIKIEFGHDQAFGARFKNVGVSIRNLELSDYEGPLGAGLQFTGSVGLIEQFGSYAPVDPAIEVSESVVWAREGLVDGSVRGAYATGDRAALTPIRDFVQSFLTTVQGNDFLAGDVVFGSGIYSAVEPPISLTSFEDESFYSGDSAELRGYTLPVAISMNDFELLSPGASKIAPQLMSDARLVDQTVLTLGPDLAVDGALGVGVSVAGGAVFVGSGLSVRGTRSESFVRSDRLSGGGHGITALSPGAFIIEGGVVSGNSGAGIVVRPSGPVRPAEAGQTRVSVSGGLAITDNHLGGLWVQGAANGMIVGGTARVTEVDFSGNRLFSMFGSGLDVIVRGGRTGNVAAGAITLSCPSVAQCPSDAFEGVPFHDEFHFHNVEVLRLLDVALSDEDPRPIFLQNVQDVAIEPSTIIPFAQEEGSSAPDSDLRRFIDGGIMWTLGSE